MGDYINSIGFCVKSICYCIKLTDQFASEEWNGSLSYILSGILFIAPGFNPGKNEDKQVAMRGITIMLNVGFLLAQECNKYRQHS